MNFGKKLVDLLQSLGISADRSEGPKSFVYHLSALLLYLRVNKFMWVSARAHTCPVLQSTPQMQPKASQTLSLLLSTLRGFNRTRIIGILEY